MNPPSRIGLALFTMLSAGMVLQAAAQGEGGSRIVKATVNAGDTIPLVELGAATVYGHWSRASRREQARYTRLMKNVIKVYPYARVTAELLAEYERDLAGIEREGDRDLYVKLAEAELRAEFEEEVRELTISQGRVLIKLIDRETGRTSYDLVKELRGSFQAWLWQGVAKLFGNDMKDDYDPAGEDRHVEHVVQRIQSGELPVADRAPRTARALARLEKRKARLYRKYGLSLAPTSMN